MRPLNRPRLHLPPAAMQTYAAVAPLASHWRPASCEEVDCQAWRNGWVTRVPAGSELAEEARSLRGTYHFTETREGGEAVFTFPPGQPCFRAGEHRVPLERDPVFLVRAGVPGIPLGTRRVHTRPEHWVEDMQESLDRTRRRVEG